MSNPWIITEPFAPMFCENVSIRGKRTGGRTFTISCKGCTFPIDDIDPYADTDAENNVKKMNVIIQKTHLPKVDFDKLYTPQIGDSVIVDTSNYNWKISKVENKIDFYELECKSC